MPFGLITFTRYIKNEARTQAFSMSTFFTFTQCINGIEFNGKCVISDFDVVVVVAVTVADAAFSRTTSNSPRMENNFGNVFLDIGHSECLRTKKWQFQFNIWFGCRWIGFFFNQKKSQVPKRSVYVVLFFLFQ